MKQIIDLLLIEDDEDDAFLTREYLEEIENFKFNVTWESAPVKARMLLAEGHFDIFLIDYRLGSESGLDLIKYLYHKKILTPSIILTGKGDVMVDRDASKYGASDYLVKAELNSSILERSIRYSLSKGQIIKALDEKEKKYSSLFERSIDPIFLATSNFHIVEMNNSFLKFFGYQPQDKVYIETIFQNKNEYNTFQETLQQTGQVKDFEVVCTTKSGEKKNCIMNCVYIPDQADDFCCYQGLIHDLTIRKKAEEDLLVAERLSLTGKIARTIAHEVRNPLTNLNLALEQIRSEIPPDSDPAKLYLDIIERNALRIAQLVDEMLSSSKPKELELELTSVANVLDAAIDLAIDRINLNQIRLRKKYEVGLPRVLLDKDKIKIAFLNIIINSIEAMVPGEGQLMIDLSYENGSLVVLISDNGKGIAQENLNKLFDPFFTAKQNGMGLGLTSTKNIFNSHNAGMAVESEVGVGTTFSIFFKTAQ